MLDLSRHPCVVPIVPPSARSSPHTLESVYASSSAPRSPPTCDAGVTGCIEVTQCGLSHMMMPGEVGWKRDEICVRVPLRLSSLFHCAPKTTQRLPPHSVVAHGQSLLHFQTHDCSARLTRRKRGNAQHGLWSSPTSPHPLATPHNATAYFGMRNDYRGTCSTQKQLPKTRAGGGCGRNVGDDAAGGQ